LLGFVASVLKLEARKPLNRPKSCVAVCCRALWRSECPDVKNYKWRLNPVWLRMLYSCTHMTTVGVNGLKNS